MDIMTDNLPISIEVSDDLAANVKGIDGVCNKLEAQLNFHTMTANWYGDEQQILLVRFSLLSENDFTRAFIQKNGAGLESIADDVILKTQRNQITCYVAITGAESGLIAQQPKLLSGYLAKKLTKVLNVIAVKQKLALI